MRDARWMALAALVWVSPACTDSAEQPCVEQAHADTPPQEPEDVGPDFTSTVDFDQLVSTAESFRFDRPQPPRVPPEGFDFVEDTEWSRYDFPVFRCSAILRLRNRLEDSTKGEWRFSYDHAFDCEDGCRYEAESCERVRPPFGQRLPLGQSELRWSCEHKVSRPVSRDRTMNARLLGAFRGYVQRSTNSPIDCGERVMPISGVRDLSIIETSATKLRGASQERQLKELMR